MNIKSVGLVKKIIGIIAAVMIFAWIFIPALKTDSDSAIGGGGNSLTAETVVIISLEFLGVIMVSVIIIGLGLGASPDRSEQARIMIVASIAGLAVILAAAGLARPVLSLIYGGAIIG